MTQHQPLQGKKEAPVEALKTMAGVMMYILFAGNVFYSAGLLAGKYGTENLFFISLFVVVVLSFFLGRISARFNIKHL